MPLAVDRADLLEGICDANEARSAPGDVTISISECAVVIPATHAETHAVSIESHERQQHEIEPACLDRLGAVRLHDAEMIRGFTRSRERFDELHADGAGIDAGQENTASAASR